MIKTSGLDKLSRDLTQAQRALEAMDGELGSVSFDPEDPQSLEIAIQQVEMLIDERLDAYSSNPLVGPMIKTLKEKYREVILEKAAAARVAGGHDNAE